MEDFYTPFFLHTTFSLSKKRTDLAKKSRGTMVLWFQSFTLVFPSYPKGYGMSITQLAYLANPFPGLESSLQNLQPSNGPGTERIHMLTGPAIQLWLQITQGMSATRHQLPNKVSNLSIQNRTHLHLLTCVFFKSASPMPPSV